MNKNDLFYLCSLLEMISRKCGLSKIEVIQMIGKQKLFHLYKVANVNHSLPIEQVSDEVMEECHISIVNEKNIKNPSIWEIGRVYQRLIEDVSNSTNWFDKIFEVYNSDISKYIDDYQKPIYWQSRSYIKECYLSGEIL